ncbi:MAG: CpaD family pilus assembly protein [Alphaproteobacteria bacterium]
MFFGPQTTKHILILTAAITLAGCASKPIAESISMSEPKRATASEVQYSHDVRFAGLGLSGDERERLEGFLAQINLRRSDGVYLVAGSRSANGKVLLGDYLTGRGVSIRSRRSDFGLKIPTADAVSIVVRRYVATLPGCPDWSGELTSYNNTPSSNWGCATATNLGLMVAEPQDLVRGRDPGYADGEAAARSIDRYRKGETKEIVPEDIGSVEGSD